MQQMEAALGDRQQGEGTSAVDEFSLGPES